MVDGDIFQRINALASEEERLYSEASQGNGLSTDASGRLKQIQVELDRCYDLLHQREARRAAGLDPRDAQARPEEIVEGYQQ